MIIKPDGIVRCRRVSGDGLCSCFLSSGPGLQLFSYKTSTDHLLILNNASQQVQYSCRGYIMYPATSLTLFCLSQSNGTSSHQSLQRSFFHTPTVHFFLLGAQQLIGKRSNILQLPFRTVKLLFNCRGLQELQFTLKKGRCKNTQKHSLANVKSKAVL